MRKKVLIVLTSHAELGDTGNKTGFWLEELASPYYAFFDAGWQTVLASPLGGLPPVDPTSEAEQWQTPSSRRFTADQDAMSALQHTLVLENVEGEQYDAIFFPGGHGPMWDLARDCSVAGLVAGFMAAGKPVGAVCHGPAALVGAVNTAGEPVVKGQRVTGFTNGEEAGVGLTDVVPFLLADKLAELGARYTSGPDWETHVVVDGSLVTGQNPASSEATAQALMTL
jgi:putative intracellular protease/amidase